jgi:nicotinamidase/pyrazinamidase
MTLSSVTLDPVRDALLVIDVQPDFMPGGPLAVEEGEQIVEPIAQLIPRFNTVVATQDWHPRNHRSFASSHPGKKPHDEIPVHGAQQTLWPDHCIQGTAGAALHRALPLDALSMILRKGANPSIDSYSAFRENYGPDAKRAPTGLAGFLRERGIWRVFVVGLARDFCVRWTAEDSVAAGFKTVVIEDLTRSVFPARASETSQVFERSGVRVVRSAGDAGREDQHK